MQSTFKNLVRAPYFDTYLAYLNSDDLQKELAFSQAELVNLLQTLSESQLDYRYAEGKWSVREVVLHCIETELIFNYRALTIARETVSQNLPGFDENAYADSAMAALLSKSDLIEYFNTTRNSSKFLVKSLTDAQLAKTGLASGKEVQVLALFYVNAGHVLHHCKVIRERYLNQ